jgi:hypothetical protein
MGLFIKMATNPFNFFPWEEKWFYMLRNNEMQMALTAWFRPTGKSMAYISEHMQTWNINIPNVANSQNQYLSSFLHPTLSLAAQQGGHYSRLGSHAN